MEVFFSFKGHWPRENKNTLKNSAYRQTVAGWGRGRGGRGVGRRSTSCRRVSLLGEVGQEGVFSQRLGERRLLWDLGV